MPIVGKGRVSVGTVVAGLVAGMGYGMMEMVIEAVGGKGFWSPLRFIASVFTLGTDTDPSFALAPRTAARWPCLQPPPRWPSWSKGKRRGSAIRPTLRVLRRAPTR